MGERLTKIDKQLMNQLREYNNYIPKSSMDQYMRRFLAAFGFFKYCPKNNLRRLFNWFRKNPVPKGKNK